MKNIFKTKHSALYHGNALDFYKVWPAANVIVSDGPYGVNGYKGDANSPEELPDIYEPHIQQWTKHAKPGATLWFWNTEIGWALVHPILKKYGWEYNGSNIWNKGKGFIAGNSNSKTLSKFPIVTEICVQYVLKPKFYYKEQEVEEKIWLRSEWQRTGLPLNKTNLAAGVKNAASRKYFTQCNLWYSPPAEQFEKIVHFANEHGDPKGYPYFSLDKKNPLTKEEWTELHPKFYCPFGVTNVWDEPMVAGNERIKQENSNKAAHSNQKPLKLMSLIIDSTSDENDIIWEPFGGLCSAMCAAIQLNRIAYGSELNKDFFELSKLRLNEFEDTFNFTDSKVAEDFENYLDSSYQLKMCL